MEGQQSMVLWIMFAAGMVFSVLLIMAWIFIKRTAYLSPVKRELKKEKQWLRRGEYNAAMVKGRQNLELLFKVVAANNGIRLDNTAAAQANARSGQERNHGRRGRSGRNRVMTHQQFGWWMEENGYLDRVAKWEMNQVRLIGNKAVHENFISKEDAWNQYNYLEDILKLVSEKHPVGGKRKGGARSRGTERGPRVPEAEGGRKAQKKNGKEGRDRQAAAKSQAAGKPQMTEKPQPKPQAEPEGREKSPQELQEPGKTAKKPSRRRRKKPKAPELSKTPGLPEAKKPEAAAPEEKKELPAPGGQKEPAKKSGNYRRRRRRKPAGASPSAGGAQGTVAAVATKG